MSSTQLKYSFDFNEHHGSNQSFRSKKKKESVVSNLLLAPCRVITIPICTGRQMYSSTLVKECDYTTIASSWYTTLCKITNVKCNNANITTISIQSSENYYPEIIHQSKLLGSIFICLSGIIRNPYGARCHNFPTFQFRKAHHRRLIHFIHEIYIIIVLKHLSSIKINFNLVYLA